MDFESLEVLFASLNLGCIKNMLMSAYHNYGAGRPPFNPLGLFRLARAKGYRSQRALEREVRVDRRVKRLCGFNENVPSHSTIVRFERRIGFERLRNLVGHVRIPRLLTWRLLGIAGACYCGFSSNKHNS